MKANLEHIAPGFGHSFSVRKFQNQFMFKDPIWHFHPEYEIVYVTNGQGKRHIANHISYYEGGDLIFIGPNLPHFGFTLDQSEGYSEVVVQLREDFLGQSFLNAPELYLIKQLFERAKTGLSFGGATRHSIGRQLMNMLDMSPFERLMSLLDILHSMALSEDFESLNANAFTLSVAPEDEQRIQTIYAYVQNNYKTDANLDTIAEMVSMTVPAFCRFFKKVTNQTFVQFVNEFRIAFACKLLRDKDMLIIDIAHQAGYNNLSHFNKQFAKITGRSPRVYKEEHKAIVHFDQI